MKYVFDVKEISYGCIEVDAENENQAREMADEQYSMGNTVWKSGEYELTNETRKPPIRSPWGEIEEVYTICEGVFSIISPNHGGVMFAKDVADKILSAEAQKIGFWEDDYLCFGDDYASDIAWRELIDKHLFEVPNDAFTSEDRYEQIINESIQRNYPEYWEHHQSQMQPRDIDRGESR